jgi:hypothetical protein
MLRGTATSLTGRCGNSIGRSPYRMTIAQDRSSDDLMRAHAALMPTITRKCCDGRRRFRSSAGMFSLLGPSCRNISTCLKRPRA